jgi:hypothetical protein
MKTGVWIKHDGSSECPIDVDMLCKIKKSSGIDLESFLSAGAWKWGGVLEYMIEPQSIDDATPEEWNNVTNKITKANDSALDIQIQGDHYKKFKIQPVEFIHANHIPFCEASAIKYLCRWKDKGGVKDLEKAKHFIDLLIELESKK